MKNERTRLLVALLCGAAAPLACSDGGAVNIGNTTAVGSQLGDYAASWDGYAEAFSFAPDGSGRVRLTIDMNGQGTLEVGNAAAPLPPPTDPNLGYPVGGYTVSGGLTTPGIGTLTALAEGFRYPLHAAAVSANRIQLGIDARDLYKQWCPLQTSYAPPSGLDYPYACLPLNGAMTIPGQGCQVTELDGTSHPVDCLKLDLCFAGVACNCTATSCVANTVPDGTPVGQYEIQIDGALDSTGSTFTGTLLLTGPNRITVVLQKK